MVCICGVYMWGVITFFCKSFSRFVTHFSIFCPVFYFTLFEKEIEIDFTHSILCSESKKPTTHINYGDYSNLKQLLDRDVHTSWYTRERETCTPRPQRSSSAATRTQRHYGDYNVKQLLDRNCTPRHAHSCAATTIQIRLRRLRHQTPHQHRRRNHMHHLRTLVHELRIPSAYL